MKSLNAVAKFHDKNRPNGDGLFVFWPQSLNTSSGKWFCNPPNAVITADVLVDALEMVQILLVHTGMSRVWIDYFKPVQEEM